MLQLHTTPPDDLATENPELHTWLADLVAQLRSHIFAVATGDGLLEASNLLKRQVKPLHPLGSLAAVQTADGIGQARFVKFSYAKNTDAPVGAGFLNGGTAHEVTNVATQSTAAIGIDYSTGAAGHYGWIMVDGIVPTPTNLPVTEDGKFVFWHGTSLTLTGGHRVGRVYNKAGQRYVRVAPESITLPYGSSLQDQIEALRVDLTRLPTFEAVNLRIESRIKTASGDLYRIAEFLQAVLLQFDNDSTLVEMRRLLSTSATYLSNMEWLTQLGQDSAQLTHIRAEATLQYREVARTWADQSGVYAQVAAERSGFAQVQAVGSQLSAEASFASQQIAEAKASEAGLSASASELSRINAEVQNVASAASATISTQQRVLADAARAAAEVASQLSATYRDTASGHATSAGDSATVSISNANISNSQRVLAEAARAEAVTAQLLSATHSTESLKNAIQLAPSTFEHGDKYFRFLIGSELTALGPLATRPDAFTLVTTADGVVLRANGTGYLHTGIRKTVALSQTGRRFRITLVGRYIASPPTGNTVVHLTTYGLKASPASDVVYGGYLNYGQATAGFQSGRAFTGVDVNTRFTLSYEFEVSPTIIADVYGNIAESIVAGCYTANATNPNLISGTVDFMSLKFEDVTDSIVSQTQASISNTQRVLAEAARASAETAQTLTATYRDTTLGYRNDTLGYRDAADGFRAQSEAQAGISNTQRVLAEAAKAAAETAQTLSATHAATSLTHANTSGGHATTALGHANTAAGHANAADTYRIETIAQAGIATAQRVLAEAARASAETAQTLTASHVTTVSGYVTTAAGHAGTAGTHAGLAEASRVQAEAQATISNSQRVLAEAARATAETASNLSVQYRRESQAILAARGYINRNATFDESTLIGWQNYNNNGAWHDHPQYGSGVYGGSLYLAFHSTDAYAIDAQKEYTLDYEIWSSGNGSTHYVGFECYDAAGVTIGNSYVNLGGAVFTGFKKGSARFRGLGASPYTIDTRFQTGTVRVRPLWLGNYPPVISGDWAYCWLLGFRETEQYYLTETQANIANAQRVLAEVARASAETAQTLTASYRDTTASHMTTAGGHATTAGTHAAAADASRVQAATEAGIANTQRVLAEAARASAETAQTLTASHVTTTSGHVTTAAGHATTAGSHKDAAGLALAATFPRQIEKTAFTHNISAMEPWVSPVDGEFADSGRTYINSPSSYYNLGIWLRGVVPYQAGKVYELTTRWLHAAGPVNNYGILYGRYFDSAGAYVTDVQIGPVQLIPAGGYADHSGRHTHAGAPSNAAFIRYGVLCNRDISLGTLYTTTTHFRACYLTDVTPLATSETQAAIANTQRVLAEAARSAAETAQTLTASYRDTTAGYRDTAGNHSSTAGGHATTAGNHATTAGGHATAAGKSNAATYPSNFVDPTQWYTDGSWLGTVTFTDGRALTTNAAALFSNYRVPIDASQSYEVFMRYRIDSSAAANTAYLGIQLRDVAGTYLTWFWLLSAANPGNGQVVTLTHTVTGAWILAQAGASAAATMQLRGLVNYQTTGAGEILEFGIRNVTPVVLAATQAGIANSQRVLAEAARAAAETAQTLTAAVYVDSVVLNGNSRFQHGTTGWWASSAGEAMNPAVIVTTAWEGNKYLYFPTSIGYRQLFSARTISIDPSKQYMGELKVGAYSGVPTSAIMQVYAGIMCLDAAGNYVDHGAYGSYRYITGAIPNTLTNGQLVTVKSPQPVTGTGNDSWYKFPPGTTQVRLVALVNYNNTDLHGYIGYFDFYDVTESQMALAQATIASSQRVLAEAARAAAETAQSLTATYRDTAASHSTTAGGHATTAAGHASAAGTARTGAEAALASATSQAGIANSQRVLAEAAAASATASSVLTANIASALLSRNPMFAQWANPAAPPDWWSFSYGSQSQLTRIAGDVGGYALDLSVGAGESNEISHSSAAGTMSAGWYVIELDIELVSGSWHGGGVRLIWYNSAATYLNGATISLPHDVDITGTVLGSAPTPKRYYFRKLVQVTEATTSSYYLGVSAGGLFHTASAGRSKIRRCGFRPATRQEVRDQTNVIPLEATVATQATAIADAASKLAAARFRVIAAASGGIPAILDIYSDNQGNSNIALKSSHIYFGDNTVFDDVTDVLLTTVGTSLRNAVAWGAPFGPDGLMQWVGAHNVAIGSMTRANAYFYIATTAPYIGGAAQGVAKETAGFGDSIIKLLIPGQSVALDAYGYVDGGGGSGTVRFRIEASPLAENSWTVVAQTDALTVAPGEPAGGFVNGTFTNSGTEATLYEFTVTVVRTPSTAGGSIVYSRTYIIG